MESTLAGLMDSYREREGQPVAAGKPYLLRAEKPLFPRQGEPPGEPTWRRLSKSLALPKWIYTGRAGYIAPTGVAHGPAA